MKTNHKLFAGDRVVRTSQAHPNARQTNQLVVPVAIAGPRHVGGTVRLPPPSTRPHFAGKRFGQKRSNKLKLQPGMVSENRDVRD
jgi:hypothetical protein